MPDEPILPWCLSSSLQQRSFLGYEPPTPTAKFIEGWNMHRRGFPRTAMVSRDAILGWIERERFRP